MKKRPFVISKRSFPGSGQYSGYWIGGGNTSWESLKMTIMGMINYHMYGIPFLGMGIEASVSLFNNSYI